jgi:acetate---CoA ligase (ADP-forming)
MTLAGPDGESKQDRASLDCLFDPHVIAVVGASRDPAKWGRRILEYTGRAGFGGALYGVNPAIADLNLPRVKTVAALADIGQPIDLAVLARPAAAVPELLDECAALGVKSILVTGAGFGELGGEHLVAERRMVARARDAGMRLLGPNTFGMFVAASGVNLTPREHIPRGSVALLSQSGNVVVGLYEQARQTGFGFSACVGVGNQVDVGLGELLAYFADDPASNTVAVYVEGLRGSGAEFRAGLTACRQAGKSVVVLKAGRSGQAASAVATHTGALASDERVWEAVLAEAGAILVQSTQDLADTLAIARSVGTHHGRAMVITDGGGDSVLAIDWLTASGLSMAKLSATTRSGLERLMPAAAPRVEACNPVTLDTAGGVEDDPMLLARCARLAAMDEGVDLIVVGGLFGGYPKMLDRELACAAELIELHKSGHPVVVQSAFALSDAEPIRRLRHSGITVLPTVDRVAIALSRTLLPPANDARESSAETSTRAPGSLVAGPVVARPVVAGPVVARPVVAGPVVAGPVVTGPAVLPVSDSAAALRLVGIDVPPISVVSTPPDLAAAAAAATYPACVKIADTAVAHKSDVGGVYLNLADATEVEAAASLLWTRFPGSPLLIMPSLARGAEFLVGTGSDPLFGPFVVVGRGGIWAETDPDLAILMAPADERAARLALLSLRCAPTFTGSRGRPGIDISAMARLIVAMSRLAIERPDLSIEVNPVIAYPDGYAVADVRASRQPGE